MNLQIVKYQHGFEFLRLSYSEFEQAFEDVIRWDLIHRQENFTPFCKELQIVVTSKSDCKKIGITLDRIVGSCDPEVLVDQVSDLSS